MQSNKSFFIITLLVAITYATAIHKNEEDINSRFLEKDLSEQDHYVNFQHNAEYDREAFLGSESKTFKQLSPDESIRRLGMIVDKIDSNKDGFVTPDELKNWIKYVQKQTVTKDLDTKWKEQNPYGKDRISWEEYHEKAYGSYAKAERQDRRRWSAADLNRDDHLSKEEFAAFIHPEESDHMKEIVVLETVDALDRDDDGRVSLTEYIGDMARGKEGAEVDEMMKVAKEQFLRHLDKNGDGTLNADEVGKWILPKDYDRAEVEARHLVHEADSNDDFQLTKDEIVKKHDLFVSSRATEYGEAMRHEF